MSLSDLASLGSFVSGLAVLASLIYLSLQVRQATKHSRALMHQGVASRIASIFVQFGSEPVLVDLGVKSAAGERAFTSHEVVVLMNAMRALLTSMEDVHFQHRAGLLGDQAFDSSERIIQNLLSVPCWRAMWILLREDYSKDFVESVDALMKSQPIIGPIDLGDALNAEIAKLAA